MSPFTRGLKFLKKFSLIRGFLRKIYALEGVSLPSTSTVHREMMREIAKEYELKMIDYSEPEENSEED
jgi:hypothetical protein